MRRLLLILAMIASIPVGATNYYFSSTGSDGANGLTPSTPKQSEAAMKAVLSGVNGGDTIYFSRGSVWSEIDINITRSGTSGNPIVLAAYGTGARPKFKGMMTMTGFFQSGNVWSKNDSRFPTSKENWIDWYTGSWQDYDRRTGFLPAIWINGTAYGLSRYPNTTPMTFSNVDNSGYTYANGASSTLPGSDALAGAQLKIMQGDWCHPFTTITGNTTTDIDITSTDFDSQYGDLDDGARGMVMNSTNATVMDQNGEYAFDLSGQYIYIYYNSNLNTQTVEIPAVDSILCLTGADYITIRGLEFIGARVHGIMLHGTIGINIIDCKVSYVGYHPIHAAGTINTEIQYCDLSNCDNGIGARFNDNINIHHNYIHKCGIDPAFGDVEGASGNGIYMSDIVDYAEMSYNYFDSINYNGIHIHANTSDASPPYLEYGNFFRRWCALKTDGAAIYNVSSNDNVSKIIRRNIAYEAADKSAWINGDGHTEGWYLDNHQSYTIVDSNSVYNSPSAVFINYGGDYNTLRGNKALTFNKSGYSNSAFYAESLGSINNHTTTGNEFVVTDAGTLLAKWNGAADPAWDCSGCSFTNNKYFSYYSGSTDFQFVEYWGTVHNYGDLSAWQTFTGLESGSTLKYLSTIGADAAVMYVNWSPDSKTFSLGTNSFKDYDNNTVSGSLTLPRYSTRILYHVSGSGGDNALYYETPVYTGTGSGGDPTPGAELRIFDQGIERFPSDQGLPMIFHAK